MGRIASTLRRVAPMVRRWGRASRVSSKRPDLVPRTACASAWMRPARSSLSPAERLWAGIRDCDGADLRRRARRRLSPHPRHTWADDRIADGVGAHASRATVMTGSATHDGALNLRAKALALAASCSKRRQAPSTSSMAWSRGEGRNPVFNRAWRDRASGWRPTDGPKAGTTPTT